MKKKNFITITKCAITSCYIEEGNMANTLDAHFYDTLSNGIAGVANIFSKASFYNNWGCKTYAQKQIWINRIRAFRGFIDNITE